MAPQSSTDRPSLWWPILSALTVVTGLLAIAVPMAAGLAATLFVGWFVMFSGGAHLWLAFEPQRLGSRLWHVLGALIYSVGGFYLIVRPDVGLVSLTLFLSVMLVAGGVFRVVAYFELRERVGAFWLLTDGVVTVLLGGMIYAGWPESSHWAVGTLVGVTIMLNGIANFMFSLAVRRIALGQTRGDVAGHVLT
ncbi:MAG: DUF308 domain-containing protein [Micropepsaceae bacterium]